MVLLFVAPGLIIEPQQSLNEYHIECRHRPHLFVSHRAGSSIDNEDRGILPGQPLLKQLVFEE